MVSIMKKILFIALSLGFIFFGISAYIQSKPAPKNERIYKIIKQHSPYYLDKRFGGLQIMSREDKAFKEKPSNMEVFHRLEALEKKWGNSHLEIRKSTLTIKDNNGTVIKTIPFENQQEIDFVHAFYSI